MKALIRGTLTHLSGTLIYYDQSEPERNMYAGVSFNRVSKVMEIKWFIFESGNGIHFN